MPDFAIIDPKNGIGEHIPTVNLSEAFMAKGSENVHFRYGRYDRFLGRLAELTDIESVKIKAPTDVFAVVTASASSIVVTGDVLSGNTVLADGDTIRINGNATSANNIAYTVSGTPVFSSPNSTITIAETIDTADNSGNVFVGATPVIKYHRHVESDTGTERLLLGTKYHILLWFNTSKTLTVKWTNLTPAEVERWEIKDHLRNVVATNNSDFVLWWNVDGSVGNDFAALDNADGIDYEGTANRLTKCKYLVSYERYLLLGFTVEAGITYPQRVRAASLGTGGTTIDFDVNGAGDAFSKDFTTTPGFMMGFGRHGDDLVVTKEQSMHRGWLVTADSVFEWQEYTLKVGNLSADSVVNDKAGRLYWLASDLTIREINTPQPISTAVDLTVKSLNTSKAEFIQGTWIDEYEEIWWAIASNNSDTNDTIVSFHPDSGRAVIAKLAVRAFGDFTQQDSFTYDTLPYGNYANWGAAWLVYDTSRNIVGFPLDIASDYSGNTFDLHTTVQDDGSDFAGVIILSTTLTNPKSLNLFKRVNNGADFIFVRRSTGSAAIFVKRDTEKSWQSLGTVSFVDTDEAEILIVHLPFDMRAKSFQFKIESSDDMQFIGMIFREFEFDGNR